MAIDTLFVFCGVYGDTADALEDYELVKKLHTQANLIDSYDAAVIERDHKGKVKIVKKHETPTLSEGCSAAGRSGYRSGDRLVPSRRHRRRPPPRNYWRGRTPRCARRSRRRRHEPW